MCRGEAHRDVFAMLGQEPDEDDQRRVLAVLQYLR
jgi:hypothetical protein